MRRTLFAISFAAVAVGLKAVSIAAPSAPCTHTSLMRVYIRQEEAIAPTVLDPLILAGEYNITPGGSSILTIAIKGSRMPLTAIRTARNEYDVAIIANTTYQLESDVILEK